jgi:hypothetical protein
MGVQARLCSDADTSCKFTRTLSRCHGVERSVADLLALLGTYLEAILGDHGLHAAGLSFVALLEVGASGKRSDHIGSLAGHCALLPFFF